MNNKIIILIISVLISFQIFSQNNFIKYDFEVKDLESLLPVPTQFNNYSSSSFIRAINEEGDYVSNYLDSDRNEYAWVVFSDRDDNKTYYDPYDKEVKGSIDFMQPFYVTEVNNNWLHLVTVKTRGISSFQIDEEIGWVHAKNLILSRFPILGEKKAPEKRMILVTASDLPKDIRQADKETLKKLFEDKHYYSNPSISNGGFIDKYMRPKRADKMKILYVIKEDEYSTAVLLASTDEIKQKSDVYGWYKNIGTTPWNTRVCLEPISGKKIEEFYKNSDNGIYDSNYVFMNNYDLETYINNSQNISEQTYLRKILIKQKRMNGMQMRYPVMPWSYKGTKRKKIAVIAQLQPDTNEEEIASAKQSLDSINRLRDTVNVVVVIDGTASMANYGPQVSKAITQIINERELRGAQIIKWGLAVYRNYADGEKLFEFVRLTDDPDAVTSKLNSIVYDSKGKSHTESHYYGMTEAIKKAGFVDGQSNIIILVGDAGNHLNDKDNLTQNSVTKLLSEKNINLISFQTHFPKNRDLAKFYRTFNTDSRAYILNTAENFIDKLQNSKGLSVSLEEINDNSFQVKYFGFNNPNRTPTFGFFNHAQKDQVLKVKEFRKTLVEKFLDYMQRLDNEKIAIESVVIGESVNNGSTREGARKFEGDTDDICRLMNWSDDLCDALKKEGEISISGYTLTNINKKPSYTEVAYISSKVKLILDERLGELALVKLNSEADTRKQFYETLVSLLQGLIGGQIDGSSFNQNIGEWTFNEAWDLLLGVQFSTESSLNNKKIKDLLTSNISDDDFEAFLLNFQRQTRSFKEYPRQKDMRGARYRSGSQVFYWIPFSKIPRGTDE